MRVITTPVGAVSGAKCGHSTTSRSGGPVARRSAAGATCGTRRRGAARTPAREPRGAPPAGGDSSSRPAGDVVERPRPRVERRAGARARRRRRPRGGAARSLQTTGVPSAIASITGAPKPSYSRGNTSASATAMQAVAVGVGHAPGRTTRAAEAERRDRAATSSSAAPRPPSSTSAQVAGRSTGRRAARAGSGGSCADGSCAGYTTTARRRGVALAQLVGRRGARPGRSTPCGTTTTRSGVDAEARRRRSRARTRWAPRRRRRAGPSAGTAASRYGRLSAREVLAGTCGTGDRGS